MKTMLTNGEQTKNEGGRTGLFPARPALRALVCAAFFALGLFFLSGSLSARADTVPYVDASGVERMAENVIVLTQENLMDYSTYNPDSSVINLPSGWYAISGELTCSYRLFIKDEVHLILCDDANFAVNKQVFIKDNRSLSIYGQTNGTGSLYVSSQQAKPGIAILDNAIFTVNGGSITAMNSLGAGIGGNSSKPCYFTINGGVVRAMGGENGAGIGSGNIVITGGTVIASAGCDGAQAIYGALSFVGVKAVETAPDTAAAVTYADLVSTCRGSYVKLAPCTQHSYENGVCVFCGMDDASIAYVDSQGSAHNCENPKTLTAENASWGNGWLAVTEDVTIDSRINIAGTVNLILCDGKTLTAPCGIHLPSGSSLTIWSQSAGTGALNAGGQVKTYIACIGGNADASCGTLVINGGSITATTKTIGAGIGGGRSGSGGTIIINGGTVTAAGGENGAGIGGGARGPGGNILINGGTVIATGGKYAAGIGGGKEGSCGSIMINGGAIHAAGGKNGAGIGSGDDAGPTSGTIEINGGTMTAAGGENGAGIGGGSSASGGTIIINNSTVTATGGKYSAGIGGGFSASGGTIIINNSTVTATGGKNAAGIGGGAGNDGDGGTIVINSAAVTARAGENAQAIGRGKKTSAASGALSLQNVRVKANGGEGSAAYIVPGESVAACRNASVEIVVCAEHAATPYGVCHFCGARCEALPALSYVNARGAEQRQEYWTPVSSDTAVWQDGWYAVTDDVTILDRVGVIGTVNLVLCDGATLCADKGIHVPPGTSLTIWRQSGGTGALVCKTPDQAQAGIGGNEYEGCGEVTVNGGSVTATGKYGAAIGTGNSGSGGVITINGGTVTANSSRHGAGIGGGATSSVDSIAITGGTVSSSSNDGAGIGGGGIGTAAKEAGNGGSITITGGQITASSAEGYGIGPGINTEDRALDGAPGTITLSWSGSTNYISASSILASTYILNKPFVYLRNGEYAGEATAENLPAKERGDILAPKHREDAQLSILYDGQSLIAGASLSLAAEAGAPGANGAWTWYSSDPDVAAVDENGLVSALGEGTALITAVYGSDSTWGEASVSLTVIAYHTVTAQTEKGGVTAEPASALPGETVTLTFVPEGINTRLNTPFVVCGGEAVETEKTGTYTYTFQMPAGDVTVSASFCEGDRFVVQFVNWDYTVLQATEYVEGQTPAYAGETPERESTEANVFTFAGWDREMAAVTEDTVYMAAYTAAPRLYAVSFLNWNGDVLQQSEVPYGETPVYTGDAPARPADGNVYAFVGWTPRIVPAAGDAAYTAAYQVTLCLTEGENVLGLMENQLLTFAFTPSVTNDYRFRCPGCPALTEIALYDGEDFLGSGKRYFSEGDIDFYAELEGGKTYTVEVLSWYGGAEITLSVTASEMYEVHVVNDDPHGELFLGGNLAMGNKAYVGQWVSLDAEVNLDDADTYVFTGVIAANADGSVIDPDWDQYMPAFEIWLRPVFTAVLPIDIQMDEGIGMDFVDAEDFMRSWDNASALPGKTVKMYPYCWDMEVEIDSVTVTTVSGEEISCFYDYDENMWMECYTFTMPDEPVKVRIRALDDVPDFEAPNFTLPMSLTAIEESAFEGDERLYAVEIPAGCQLIGKWAFKDCANLWMIRVPANCQIGEDAFAGCEEVYVYSEENSFAQEYCQNHDNCTFVEE